jgi:hypothetical protein
MEEAFREHPEDKGLRYAAKKATPEESSGDWGEGPMKVVS